MRRPASTGPGGAPLATRSRMRAFLLRLLRVTTTGLLGCVFLYEALIFQPRMLALDAGLLWAAGLCQAGIPTPHRDGDAVFNRSTHWARRPWQAAPRVLCGVFVRGTAAPSEPAAWGRYVAVMPVDGVLRPEHHNSVAATCSWRVVVDRMEGIHLPLRMDAALWHLFWTLHADPALNEAVINTFTWRRVRRSQIADVTPAPARPAAVLSPANPHRRDGHGFHAAAASTRTRNVVPEACCQRRQP